VQSGVEVRAAAPADASCTLSINEPWLGTPKAVAVARFPLAEEPALLVISLHAINFTLGVSDYRDMLGLLGSLLDAHPGPAVVAGDFNHWNPWRAAALEAFATAEHLHWLPVSPDRRSRHFGQIVDGILLRDLGGAAGSALPTRSSDHNPIIGTLLPTPRPSAAADSDAAVN
jgi:endonuclease/exonuclease/phosphatase (EEP) superfamily protein YafD